MRPPCRPPFSTAAVCLAAAAAADGAPVDRAAGAGGGGNVTATVTLKNGEQFTGIPDLISDFVVEIRTADGDDKTWLRDGEWPKVNS